MPTAPDNSTLEPILELLRQSDPKHVHQGLALLHAIDTDGHLHDALIEGYDSYEDMPEDVAVKAQALSNEIDAISAKRPAYDPAIIERGGVFVSPYNDLDIIAGQGTIGVEILEQLPALDAVFVAAGGGGLLAGIAAYVKHAKPSCKVIGCSVSQPAASAAYPPFT